MTNSCYRENRAFAVKTVKADQNPNVNPETKICFKPIYRSENIHLFLKYFLFYFMLFFTVRELLLIFFNPSKGKLSNTKTSRRKKTYSNINRGQIG